VIVILVINNCKLPLSLSPSYPTLVVALLSSTYLLIALITAPIVAPIIAPIIVVVTIVVPVRIVACKSLGARA
jgi:hypothetical protein